MSNEPLGLVEESQRRRQIFFAKLPKPPATVTPTQAQLARKIADAVAKDRATRTVARFPTPASIIAACCDQFCVTEAEIFGRWRPIRIGRGRAAVYLMMRELLPLSYPKIAVLMKRKDHTTCISGAKRAQYLIARDPDFSRRYTRATEMVK